MQSSCFSIATDGSNDQGLKKMTPATVRLFDINQHKVVTKFYDMCTSTSSTAVGMFTAINDALVKNDISWDKCVSLAVDNTSVNVGRHNCVIVEAKKKNEDIILMGCPCHIAYNTLVKLPTLSSKWLTILMLNSFSLSEFCDQQYCKIIKFHSVHWLGLSTCIERVLKLLPH